jgi:hypothetical protein
VVAVGFGVLWRENDSWLYSKVEELDTWYYVAYALHWRDGQFMQWYYKASRVLWILYEFVHYQLLGPERAVPVVQLGCYLSLLVANYLFIRRLFDRSISALTSVGLVFWTHIHANGGADYHNTICGPLFTWCAYATLRNAQERSYPFLFMIPGGLCLALFVTSPLYLNLALVFPALYLFTWWPQKDIRYLLLSCLWAIVGAALAFALLGFVNKLAGHEFFFVAPLLAITKQLVIEGGNSVWWKGWGWWVLAPSYSYLGPIAAMLLVSLAELSRLSRQKEWTAIQSRAAILHGLYIFHTMVWIAWQTFGQTTLDFPYFAYPLWVLWFWSLAAVLGVNMRERDATLPTSYILVAVAALVCGTVLVLQRGSSVNDMLSGALRYHLLEAGAATLIFYAVILVSRTSALTAVIGGFVILYPLLDLVSGTFINYYYRPMNCPYGADGFRAIVAAGRWVNEHTVTPEDALLWWDEDEPMPDHPPCQRHIRYRYFGYTLAVLASGSKCLGPAWPIRPVDAIPDDDIERASDRRHVVAIVTSNPENVKKMRERFARQGTTLELIDQRTFRSETLDFSVYLLHADHLPK